jgi:hypothetical protein
LTRRSPFALRRDQAARLEPVGDPCHVGGVADEPLGEGAHRQRAVVLEEPQRQRLREAEPELGDPSADAHQPSR